MLTQVDVAGTDGAASTIPGGSPGTSGQADDRALAGNRTDADIATTPTYTLRSLERGTDLGKYIGKRVTVTGRLTADRDQTGLGTRGTTSGEQTGAAGDDKLRSEPPGATAAAGATPAAANVRQLDAQSIRTVAGTCTRRSSAAEQGGTAGCGMAGARRAPATQHPPAQSLTFKPVRPLVRCS